MTHLTIACMSCGQHWQVANAFSLYEQQAVESCPCPQCGAYTLCCREPNEIGVAARQYESWGRIPVPVEP